MRLGVLGGSFDPPHRGHQAIAKAAAETYHLSRILVLPTGRQPMKPSGASASYVDRMAMTALMCARDPQLELSAIDAPRPDGTPNYTVDTLQRLRGEVPSSVNIFAIVGADSFIEFPRWHRAQDLLRLAEWVVVSRPGFPVRMDEIGDLGPDAGSRVHMLPSVHEDVSATDLRDRLERGEDCSSFLSRDVASYIEQNHLYR